tara:strand:+ start:900 stop:2081 length:1182 start_codon:yes stop_codon:yes gene_type:complete
MSSNLKVNTILPSTGTAIGIGTASGNIDVLGHIVGHNTPNLSGINSVTANTFYGSGANLTGISAGTSLSGSTNNTVCTVTGANAIQGEANLTFDGTELKIGGDSSVAGTFGLEVYNTASNEGTALIAGTQGARLDIMDTGSSERLRISASGAIYFISYKSGDDIIFQNTTGSGTAEVLRVKTDGIKVTSKNAHGTAIQMYNTDSSSNVWHVNGEGDSFCGNIYPRSDANKDLGFHSGYRWRDVVLSGGIRFGSANSTDYLDDYEEGTWTPTLVNAPSGASIPTHTGYYTKVGNMCTLWLQGPTISGNNSSNNIVQIGGIPFSCASGFVATGIPRGYGVYRDSNHTWVTFLDSGNNIMWGQLDENVSWTQLKYSGLQNTTGHVTFQITLTYKTT